jgi:NAD(P)H-dependent FMN reductase
MIKIQVILGSTREGRFSEKPGAWIMGELKKLEGVEAELLDLRQYPMPFYEEAKMTSELKGHYKSEAATRWAKKIGEGDAFIIIAPEYNHGYPAVLKNAIDYGYSGGWAKKPAGFISYGGAGGVRSVEQLRQSLIILDMVPIQKAITIPAFWTALDEEGNFNPESVESQKEGFLTQLMWWAKLLKPAREAQ